MVARDRILIIALFLTGCDVIAAKPDPSICSPMAPDAIIDVWQKEAANYDAEQGVTRSALDARQHLLADCLVVHARQFSKGSDVSSVVARAVMAACQSEGSDYSDAYEASHGMNVLQVHDPYSAKEMMDEIDVVQPKLQKSISDTALRYVMEARAGRCVIDRRSAQMNSSYASMPDIDI